MYRSQALAIKYFSAAIALFGVMTVFGLMAAYYYIDPQFLFGILPFNITKILHINTLIIWILMGFMGSIYWFLPEELGRELADIRAAEILFYVFCATIAVVALVLLFVQHGSSNEWALWFINQGRKYVEAPRWAALVIVGVMVVFAWNVIGTAIAARKTTGIVTVLMIDLVPLVVLYLDAFPAASNMSLDLFWWWWLVHLWVEATWEVLIGCIMAFALMSLFGTSRWIVETWLYIEVALVLGSGILGLGHHYFWIGTPRYWFAIGGFFSAFEPLPLLGMVIHAVYDAGTQHMKSTNRPALYWMMAEALGNFLGGGVWGFMITLPQVNLYAHGRPTNLLLLATASRAAAGNDATKRTAAADNPTVRYGQLFKCLSRRMFRVPRRSGISQRAFGRKSGTVRKPPTGTLEKRILRVLARAGLEQV